jgi:hypothetical protein
MLKIRLMGLAGTFAFCAISSVSAQQLDLGHQMLPPYVTEPSPTFRGYGGPPTYPQPAQPYQQPQAYQPVQPPQIYQPQTQRSLIPNVGGMAGTTFNPGR